jgi:hypothetical protein
MNMFEITIPALLYGADAIGRLARTYKDVTGVTIGEHAIKLMHQWNSQHEPIHKLDSNILYAPTKRQVVYGQAPGHRLPDAVLVDQLRPIAMATQGPVLATLPAALPPIVESQMNQNPRELFFAIQPVEFAKAPRPDLFPIAYTERGRAFIGWQKRGVLKTFFDGFVPEDQDQIGTFIRKEISRLYWATASHVIFPANQSDLDSRFGKLFTFQPMEKVVAVITTGYTDDIWNTIAFTNRAMCCVNNQRKKLLGRFTVEYHELVYFKPRVVGLFINSLYISPGREIDYYGINQTTQKSLEKLLRRIAAAYESGQIT